MTSRLKIDFVSDVACPWCAVGLGGLEQALQRLPDDVQVDLHFQPFQLNPQMPPEGEDMVEHLQRKYGSTPEQQAANWAALCERAAAAGFEFRREGRGRTWNTFDAHRLLHWAGEQGGEAQHRLKRALLEAYFGRGESPAAPEVLLAAARAAGLDEAGAKAVIEDATAHAAGVRERQQFYAQHGIQAVPSVIVNDQYLIQGGQPAEAYEQALRQIAQQAGA